MNKRILSGLMAGVMTLSMLTGASAARLVPESECAQVVGALGIMVGDEKGDLNLDRDVNRAEFTTMAVKASVQGDQVGQASSSPYPDVPRKHWAAAYVEAAVRMGLISGYLDGTFRPNNKITLGEGASIALKLLGYTAQDFQGAYPTAQMSLYHSLSLDVGLRAKNASDLLDRRDSMYLFYNLLSAKTKSGQPYLNTLGYALGADGEVDRVSLMAQVMDGPIVADDRWREKIPFSPDKAQVRRNGRPSETAAIQNGDVLYYNDSTYTIWAYTERVTGTIRALTPSAANPTAVNVAGQTYPIETSEAAYALSDLGDYRLGDTVTLALGRSGGVAAVLRPSEGDRSKLGIVTAVGRGQYTSGNGQPYTDDTVTILATDGRTYSYQWDARQYEVGDLAQVQVDANGEAALKRIQENHLEGKVSADGTMLGKREFAENVEIMDTYENVGIRVFPDRLAGVYLKKDMVRCYELDPQGRIETLILNDVTGDMHQYGVMTNVLDQSGYMFIMVNYTMDLGGQVVSLPSQGKKYPVEKGPMMLKGQVNDPDVLTQLKRVNVDSIQNNILRTGSQSFTLFDNTLVYEYENGVYYLSSLERVNDHDHRLTAWYDKQANEGGCVRVIVAEKTK